MLREDEAFHRAEAIAAAAHAGQQDKLGRPFIEHLHRVASRVTGHEAKTIAYLHDLLEKAEGWSAERLRQDGFSPAVIAAVEAMTRREGEDYLAFAQRAGADPHARPVKFADLHDNRQQALEGGKGTERYDAALDLLHRLYDD